MLGVVPYAALDLEDEDSLSSRLNAKRTDALVDVAVIRLPRISNFTDFNPLETLEGIGVRYVADRSEFGQPDFVILPGTTSTMGDLKWLRESGLETLILKHVAAGKGVLGICGGFQMMGQSLKDPTGVEGGLPVEGYEIHMGETKPEGKSVSFSTVSVPGCGQKTDGCCAGNLYGTYLHGLFESGEIAASFACALLESKGYNPGEVQAMDVSQLREREYDKLANLLRESLDMREIYRILEAGA